MYLELRNRNKAKAGSVQAGKHGQERKAKPMAR